MPVPCACGFSSAPTALKRLAIAPSRSDYRDRDIGPSGQAMNVGDLELLENVLGGVALLAGVAARRRCRIAGLLLQGVDVVRLHDRGHPDIGKRLDGLRRGSAVGDAQAHHGRSRAGQRLRRDHRQPETAHRVLQLVRAEAGGDLHHHLVLDHAGLAGGRNIDDAAVQARQDLLPGGTRRRHRRLHWYVDSARVVEQRRGVGVGERDELNVLDQVADDLRLPREGREEFGRQRDELRVLDEIADDLRLHRERLRKRLG
jgi:hypothetical protein